MRGALTNRKPEEAAVGMEATHLGPNFARNLHSYGQNSFSGAVAKKYLLQVGIPLVDVGHVFADASLLEEYADLVAAAVLQWAREREATMFTHAFQPLGSEGMRAGATGQVRHARLRNKRKTLLK